MKKFCYPATTLVGGGDGALDAIDGAGLQDQDAAIVFNSAGVYFFVLDADSALDESSPSIIKPDSNAGDKRWINVYAAAGNSTVREAHIATDGQTTFTLANTYATNQENILVVREGLILAETEYTETDANTVTLANPAVPGDRVEFFIGANISTGDAVQAAIDAQTAQAAAEVAQAAAELAETNAELAETNAETAETNASEYADEAENWAKKTDDYVEGTDNSAKSWAVGGTGDGAPSDGCAKDWATKAEDSVVSGGEYSAYHWAQKAQAAGDNTVKVSSNDTTAGYLNGKLLAGEGIDLTEGSDGGDETLTIVGEDASDSNKGIVELATDAETQALTLTDKAVTPGNLGALSASDSQKGIVELATGAETAAGASATLAVTPDGLADLLQYEHAWIPAAAMTPRTTNGPEAVTNEYTTNDHTLDVLAFDGATEEFATFPFRMPSTWDRGTVKAKFHWAPGDSACTAGDTVEWEISGVAVSDDDAIDATTGTGQVISDTVLAGKDGDLHISGATPAITIGGTPALGDLIIFSISRNVSGTDDMTEDAYLIGIVLEIKHTNTVSAW